MTYMPATCAVCNRESDQREMTYRRSTDMWLHISCAVAVLLGVMTDEELATRISGLREHLESVSGTARRNLKPIDILGS